MLKGDVLIEDDRIVKVGEVRGPADHVIDARGKLIVPGFVNAHTHSPMSLMRGYAEDLGLEEWLAGKIWPVEEKLKPHHVRAGALLSCLEMIKSGITCFFDMYFFMEEVARAVEASGLRAVLSYGIIDLGDPDRRKRELAKARELLVLRGSAEGRIEIALGPHAPYTCSEECLLEVRRLAEKHQTRIHMHLSESMGEVQRFLEQKGKRPVEYLREIGFLGPNLTAAHCVHLDQREIKILAQEGVSVVHNPTSNLKLGCGIAPVIEMIDQGINLSLGTDGPASNNTLNIFQEMKLCALLQKGKRRDPTRPRTTEVLGMATQGGARALGLQDVGRIEPSAKADVVLIDLKAPNLRPVLDLRAALVYSARPENVSHVIVGGKLLMENRQILSLDEEEVLEKAEKASQELLSDDED